VKVSFFHMHHKKQQGMNYRNIASHPERESAAGGQTSTSTQN